MRRIVRDIIDSLESQPEEWHLSYFTYARRDGIEVWRANVPILNIGLYRPYQIRFSLIEKFAVYFAFRRWLRNMPLTGYPKVQP